MTSSVKAVYKLPLTTFEKANEVFLMDNKNNPILSAQYTSKRTKREKIKFLRYMGYLDLAKSEQQQ
jgi:hypothetical protein